MADGSAGDPYHVVIDGFETTGTPVPVSQSGSWGVESTATVGGFSGGWDQEVHGVSSAGLVLVGAVLLVLVAQLVLAVKR